MKCFKIVLFLALVFIILSIIFSREENIVGDSEAKDHSQHKAFISDETLGFVWFEEENNPNPPPSTCPEWNCLAIADPWIGIGESGDYMMFFTASGDENIKEGYPFIGRAEFTNDLRVTFNPDMPIIREAEERWDRAVETVTLLWNEEVRRWDMWYLGWKMNLFDEPGIGHMRSLDPSGIKWERSEEPIYRPEPNGWDNKLLSGPSAMRGPDGLWRIYYTGAEENLLQQGIGLLTSKDGINWIPHPKNPIFTGDPNSWDSTIIESCVRYVNNRYMMWYSGYRGPLKNETRISIGVATSDDGIVWERYDKNPIIKPGYSKSWNALRILSPSVLVEPDGGLLMAAYGRRKKQNTFGMTGFWRSH